MTFDFGDYLTKCDFDLHVGRGDCSICLSIEFVNHV